VFYAFILQITRGNFAVFITVQLRTKMNLLDIEVKDQGQGEIRYGQKLSFENQPLW